MSEGRLRQIENELRRLSNALDINRVRKAIIQFGLGRERGDYFVDTSTPLLYLVFGEDESWEAIEWDGTDAYSTGADQTGSMPMSLAACMALTYDQPYAP